MTFRATSSGEMLHRVPDDRPEKIAGVKALCGAQPPFWSRPLDPEQGGPICPDCEAAAEFDALIAEGQALSRKMRRDGAGMRHFTPEEMAVRVRAAKETP